MKRNRKKEPTEAERAYADARAQVDAAMNRLSIYLMQHKRRQQADPDNRAYVGDLNYIAETLKQIEPGIGDHPGCGCATGTEVE